MRSSRSLARWLSLTLALGLAACGSVPTAPPPPPEAAPAVATCPKGVPEGARCWRGIDSA
jgi:hypothetical protein